MPCMFIPFPRVQFEKFKKDAISLLQSLSSNNELLAR